MSDDFAASQASNVQELVENLISELKETTFQSGKIEASFYREELPRFTNGNFQPKKKIRHFRKLT